ncbi:MAG TPA: hypothetical protein PLX89_18305 [Verrucomicrobiota bacterium]|nr:hypothetical protein [Verrucomicrobiales bacterium]HRI14952.1 hypothetical protein [Verrucomicrobiota bacterium]
MNPASKPAESGALNVDSINLPGSQGAIIAPSGTVTQNFGPTVEQLRALSEAFTQQAGNTQNQRVVFSEFRGVIEASRQQIRPMSDYKTAHDLLQEIELSGRALRDQVYEGDQLLSAPQIRWRALMGGRNELTHRLRELREFLAQCPFGANETSFGDDLLRAETELAAAFETRDLVRLDGTIQLVAEILGSQLSRMNDRLIGALDAFNLVQLAITLRALAGRLGANSATSIAALDSLDAAGRELASLRALHDELQQLDNELRNLETLLWGDVGRFRTRWQSRLKRRFALALDHLAALQLLSRLSVVAEALDAALQNAVAPGSVVDSFLEVRSELLQVFNRVDRDLRRRCEALRDADGPLGAVLDSLPRN